MRETGACRIVWPCLSAGRHLFFQHTLLLSESKTSSTWLGPSLPSDLSGTAQDGTAIISSPFQPDVGASCAGISPTGQMEQDVVSQNVSGCGVEFIQEHEMGTWGSAQALLEDIRERHLAGDSCGAENPGTDSPGKWGPCFLHMSQMV